MEGGGGEGGNSSVLLRYSKRQDKVPRDNLGAKRKMTNCTFGYNGIVHEILRHSFLVSISQYVYNKLS